MRKQIVIGLSLSAALMILTIAGAVSSRPQLQQSGGAGSQTSIVQGGNTATVSAGGALKVDGSGVTQPVSGTVTATEGGIWTVQPGNTANTTPWLVTGSGGNFPATQSGTWTVQPGNTANTTAWLVKNVPSTTCGTTAVDSGILNNIATGAGTDLFTAATCVGSVFISNTTSSAVTVTIKDKAGTPNTYVNAFSIPGNSNVLLPMNYMKLAGGVTLIAGTSSALNAQAVGFQ